LLSALVLGWFAANDPPELRQYIQGLGVGIARQRSLSTYIRTVIKKRGVEAVMRWAESVPDDDANYKTAVYRQVGFRVTMHDVEAGIRWCEAHCDGPYGKDLRNSISRRWVRTGGGAAALAWLSSAPAGWEKDFDVRVTFAEWAQVDREAAMAWMAAQPTDEPNPLLQPILPVYAKLLAEDSPADAIGWAEQIEHDKKRRFALIHVARAWRQVDEAATEAWLLQSSLSEEDREKVRAPEWDRRS
jgi:hypothetical protein